VTAEEIIAHLKLKPHPREDGFFIETYRSTEKTAWEALPPRYDGTRSHSTAIYFLLTSKGFSEMHRIQSDEIFHFYAGATTKLLLLYPQTGRGQVLKLGNDLLSDESPQIVVPRGCWQGMRTTGEFTLMGTTVAPGFEYSDYESGNREELIRLYPAFADRIRALTR
jgi:predicted cupin superfamily sugar epimerase